MIGLQGYGWILALVGGLGLSVGLACGETQATEAPEGSPAVSWTATQLPLLDSLRLANLPAPPPDLGNRFGDDPRAAALGEKLFFEARLSRNAEVSCATCHQPDRGFTDGRARSVGLAALDRNAPSLLDVAYLRWFFWDGRADSLWSQALVALVAPKEMGADQEAVVSLLRDDPELSESYAAAFDVEPKRAGDPHVFAKVGKALAAYQRSLRSAPTRFDAYVEALVAGDPFGGNALSAREAAGLALFVGRAGCVSCHLGPLFSDGGFHNIGTGPGVDGRPPDRGRAAAEVLLASPWNCRSQLADPVEPSPSCAHLERIAAAEVPALLEGAFRTPGLRGLQQTAPYMHDGRFADLDQVLRHYLNPPDKATLPHELPAQLDLSPGEISHLKAFLMALTGT